MKKFMIICSGLILFSFTVVNAQSVLDKIDRASDKADRAGNTANRSKNTGDKLLGLFGKKKESGTAETKTTIKITGIDFAALNALNEKLQSAKGVESTKMKFSATGSSLILQHAGQTADLFKTLQKASPEIFAEKNISGMDDGEISVKLK